MANDITAILDDVTIKGPFKKTLKNAKTGQAFESTFYTKVLVAGGIEYAQFQQEDTAKESPGDKVKITFTPVQGKTGSYNKIVEVSTLNKTPEVIRPVEQATMPTTPPAMAQTTSVERTAATTVHIRPTSKDISMEVSGILQALLSTGQYNMTNQDGKTYVAEELLEMHLRKILSIKRKVASDLELS